MMRWVAAWVCFVLASACMAAPQYEVTLLKGVTGAGEVAKVQAVNNSGQVVGRQRYINADAYYHALIWDKAGNVTDLNSPTRLGGWGAAYAINDGGDVLGTMRNTASIYRTNQLWRSFSGWTLNSELLYSGGVNSKGQAFATDATGGPSYYMNALGQITQFPQNTIPRAINNSGQVVGEGGFLWTEGGAYTYLPVPSGFTSISAKDINDPGQIAGDVYDSVSKRYRAFIYDSDAGVQPLPLLASYDTTRAYAINDSGDVIGVAYNLGVSGAKSVLWHAGQAYDLNTLIPANSGWTLGQLTDISDTGYIVGTGTYNGQSAAFLLTAVPEPGIGFAMIAALDILWHRPRRATPSRAAGK